MPSPSSLLPASLSSPWPATEQTSAAPTTAAHAPPCFGPRRRSGLVVRVAGPCRARVRPPCLRVIRVEEKCAAGHKQSADQATPSVVKTNTASNARSSLSFMKGHMGKG